MGFLGFADWTENAQPLIAEVDDWQADKALAFNKGRAFQIAAAVAQPVGVVGKARRVRNASRRQKRYLLWPA
jgi:hypothetical protein